MPKCLSRMLRTVAPPMYKCCPKGLINLPDSINSRVRKMNRPHTSILAVLHIGILQTIVLCDPKATLRVQVETQPRPIPILSFFHHRLLKPTVLRRLSLIKVPCPRPIRNIAENRLVSRSFGPPRNTLGNHCLNSSLISPTRLSNMLQNSISSVTGTGLKYATWR